MRQQEKRRILATICLIGVLCIMLVCVSAFAAEIRHENNNLISANTALQGEVDTLDVQIKTKTGIDFIETYATTKLGMVYPDSDECIYISDEDAPGGDFAAVLKEDAYN